MLGFYLLCLMLILCFAYAGYEGTMRIFVYLDLTLRHWSIKFKLWMIRRRLEKKLNFPRTNLFKHFQETFNEQ
jgi:hypothetical protein